MSGHRIGLLDGRTLALGALSLLIGAAGARAETSPFVTFVGHVAAVTPFGESAAEGPGQSVSSCGLQSGEVLACATSLESGAPPTCSPLNESTCDFSIDLPLREDAAMGALFFVQDDDGNAEPDAGERVAQLIDEEQGAPVCSGDVLRFDDVDVDFAAAAPSAASIRKLSDACAG